MTEYTDLVDAVAAMGTIYMYIYGTRVIILSFVYDRVKLLCDIDPNEDKVWEAFLR